MKELYQKFLTDVQEVECSYTQFCCNVPKEIIKPKPEDWGTCLCMPCLNPELNLEAIKRTLGGTHNLTTESLKDKRFEEDIKDLCHQIEKSDTASEKLEWYKEEGQDVRASSYFSEKNTCSSSGKEFSKKFKEDIESLVNHTSRFKSQYQRIAEVKHSFKIHQERVSCCVLIGLKMSIFTRPLKKNHNITHQYLLVSTQLFYIRLMKLKVYVQ